jgi:hypothetical protein
MATPTLQDVFAAVPAIATAIDEMTELIPGVPSNKRTLEELLKDLDNEYKVQTEPSPFKVWWEMFTNRDYDEDSDGEQVPGKKHIQLAMYAPKTDTKINTIYSGHYDATPKGLMEAITDGKRVMKRYRVDGLCKECETPDRKRLRGEGMPHCASCIIKKALE